MNDEGRLHSAPATIAIPSTSILAEVRDGVAGTFRLPDSFGRRFPGRTLAEIAAIDWAYIEWLASDAVTSADVRGAAQAFLAAGGKPGNVIDLRAARARRGR